MRGSGSSASRRSTGFGVTLPELFELLAEAGRADANIPQTLRGHFTTVEILRHGPNEARNEHWPRRIADGAVFGNAQSEPAAPMWLSWDTPGGAAPERELWDTGTARRIDHHGEFFDVTGPLNVPIGPQGHPVICQAGASDAGIDFAAKHAELMYAALLSKPAAAAYGAQLRELAAEHSRDPDRFGRRAAVPGWLHPRWPTW